MHRDTVRQSRSRGVSPRCTTAQIAALIALCSSPPTPLDMRCALSFVGLLLLASCRDPRAEANIAEAMIQVGTQMSAMQQDYALLQQQLDSLRMVVARQDTLITRLASLSNMPLPPH